MGISYNPRVITDGLVLALDAGNTKSYNAGISTTAWNDLSGRGNNATLTNGPTYSSANGGSIVFDGVNDYGVKNSHSITPINGVTMDVWINLNSITFSASESGILNHSGFTYLNLNFIKSSQKFRLEYKSVSANNTQLFSTQTISASTWYNFVGVVDNTGGAKIYINGVLDNFNSVNANLSGIISSNLVIGYDAGGFYPNMKIAVVKEYNRVLTPSEIQQNFNATRSRYGI